MDRLRMSPPASPPNGTLPPAADARNANPRSFLAQAHATICLAVALVAAAPTGLRGAELAATTTSDRAPDQVRPLLLAASMVEVASPGQADCGVSAGPSEALPSGAYVLIRGLPLAAVLSDGEPWWEKIEGQAEKTRAWAVSFKGTKGLKVLMPGGVSGEYDLTVVLFDGDGRVLDEQLSTLRVTPRAAVAPLQSVASLQREPNETRTAALSPPTVLLPTPVAPAPAEPKSGTADRPAPAAEQLAQAERMLARGEGYLARGDIAIAREYFERAAALGLPIAALRMAETQDPRELARRGVHGVKADLAEARRWYQRAIELRVPEAESRLQRLGGK